jgi:hypothetical protein
MIFSEWREWIKKEPSYHVIEDEFYEDGVYGSIEKLIASIESGEQERHYSALVRNNALDERKIAAWLNSLNYRTGEL